MEEYVQCSRCNKWMVDEDDDCDSEFYVLDEEHVLCNECFEQELKQDFSDYPVYYCDNCYKFVDDISSDNLCDDCYIIAYTEYCDECGSEFPIYALLENNANGLICESCKKDKCICNRCRNVIDDFRELDLSKDGKIYCYNCINNENENALIKAATFKPKPHFIGKSDIYFGIELEVGYLIPDSRDIKLEINKVYKKLQKLSGHNWIYFKHDSSIEETDADCRHSYSVFDVECVTEPLSYRWIKSNINRKLKDLFNLKKLGFYSNELNSCGMHVHIDKTALTKFQTEILTLIFKDNFMVSDEKEILRRICLRKETHPYYKECIDFDKKTIEFRMFNSTLNPKIFMQNIDIVKSLIDFIKQQKDYVYLKDYVKFLKKSKNKSYKTLVNRLTKTKKSSIEIKPLRIPE